MLASDAKMVLHVALKLFGAQSGWQEKSGMYLCVADHKTGLPLAVVPIGQVPVERAEKYARLSQEKALRLAQHPEHSSSWESRNQLKDEWGGAVRVGVFIISISGLPELGDEAVALEVAWPRDTEAALELIAEIAEKSNNPYRENLSKAVREERAYQEHAGT